jgi:hypothetical protein
MRTLPPPEIECINPPVRDYAYFDDAQRGFDPALGLADARNRWMLSECALLAYDGREKILSAVRNWLPGVHVPPDGDPHEGFCYGVDIDHGNALLAFRGTQVFNFGDPPAKFRHVLADLVTDAGVEPLDVGGGATVHRGFHQLMSSLLSSRNVVNGVDQGMAAWIAARPRRWWLCGHSLGGALAVLAAEQLHAMPGHSIGGVLTLGQPRVGNARHAQRLKELHIPILRLVHGCDAIPTVPPELLDYAHAGDEHHYAAQRREQFAQTLIDNLLDFTAPLRHGIGALTPLELRDHAPLTYATHCYNEFRPGDERR